MILSIKKLQQPKIINYTSLTKQMKISFKSPLLKLIKVLSRIKEFILNSSVLKKKEKL